MACPSTLSICITARAIPSNAAPIIAIKLAIIIPLFAAKRLPAGKDTGSTNYRAHGSGPGAYYGPSHCFAHHIARRMPGIGVGAQNQQAQQGGQGYHTSGGSAAGKPQNPSNRSVQVSSPDPRLTQNFMESLTGVSTPRIDSEEMLLPLGMMRGREEERRCSRLSPGPIKSTVTLQPPYFYPVHLPVTDSPTEFNLRYYLKPVASRLNCIWMDQVARVFSSG